jgi:epoxyqueuosine reductase
VIPGPRPGAAGGTPPTESAGLASAVRRAMLAAGLDAVGVTGAEPFEGTRRDLYERRAAGLHGGMAFTYRNPDRSTDPDRTVAGARSLVVGAYRYLRRPPDPPPGGPVTAPTPPGATAPARVARYAWEDFYAQLTLGLEAGAAVLRAAGHRAVVVADQNALVDREAAQRAGLGWYGRNSNLLLPRRGSWFVLGSVVTDADLPHDTPVEPACGTCTRCLDGCPTGAIVAAGVVDARRCLAWLLQATGPFPWELRVALGDRIYGCDDCQEVCPPNVADRTEPPRASTGARPTIDAVTFLQPDDDEVVAAAGRWYVPQRKARYLRRNALVVLGNTADPSDPAAVAAVERCLASPDPLVRAHAVWAAARLGRPELADGLVTTEADPMVREELDRRASVPRRHVSR